MRKSSGNAAKRKGLLIRAGASLLAVVLSSAVLSQTAFAKTYVIKDGDRVVTYTTFATDPAEVLGRAGVELTQYDTYTTEAVDGGEDITIRRAQSGTVWYHGEETTVSTFGETTSPPMLWKPKPGTAWSCASTASSPPGRPIRLPSAIR